MSFNVIGLFISVMILVGGLYYLFQYKDDKESRNIYLIVSLIGLVATIIFIIRFL
ncbi:MAG: hypothetical protein LUF02_10960 [Erysipelotrichaceae bacterium]|nr:hypothetical protein [Erysipelotrichaceae bacterium]